MALEAIAGNDNPSFTIHDSIPAIEQHPKSPKFTSFLPRTDIPKTPAAAQALHSIDCELCPFNLHVQLSKSPMMFGRTNPSETVGRKPNSGGGQGKKKRRRRPRVCKNKEEAETQRMTHIAVERNRRKQMNEHLAVLRSLMPESYIQRSDQASTVGGAIDFVKELEQHLQSLEAQKRLLSQQKLGREGKHVSSNSNSSNGNIAGLGSPPFAQFFSYPQYSWCQQAPREHHLQQQAADQTSSTGQRAVADIEATLIESHANLKILWRKRSRQLMKIVAGFQSMSLTILHLNVTALDSFVLYSFSLKINCDERMHMISHHSLQVNLGSALENLHLHSLKNQFKVEEECHLSSADDIAAAVHHMLTIIEDEAQLPLLPQLG
ncbi:hypothetical protein ACLOJK_033868 [Asimina triloba]